MSSYSATRADWEERGGQTGRGRRVVEGASPVLAEGKGSDFVSPPPRAMRGLSRSECMRAVLETRTPLGMRRSGGE